MTTSEPVQPWAMSKRLTGKNQSMKGVEVILLPGQSQRAEASLCAKLEILSENKQGPRVYTPSNWLDQVLGSPASDSAQWASTLLLTDC